MGATARSRRYARPALPGLHWTTSADAAALRNAGYTVLALADIRRDYIVPARDLTERTSLANPAQPLLDLLATGEQVAVTGVPTGRNGDLRELYGYLLEPAWRRQLDLVIAADKQFEELDPDALLEADLGYPWTLERLRFVADRYLRHQVGELPPLTPIELQLYDALRSTGLSPLVQHGIGRFRLDFAFPDVQLAVEADGREWHDPARDRRRDALLKSEGWRVVRFTGSQIHHDPDACAESVAQLYLELASAIRYTALETAPEEDAVRRSWLARLFDRIRALLTRSTLALTSRGERSDPDLLPADEPVPAWLESLDESQRRATRAGAGVVQVIAPAGSGKTKTLVARVQELLSRGVPPNRILCCTFNRKAADELRRRLDTAGVEQVAVRNFHGLGWRVLDRAGELRTTIGEVGYGEWRWLAGKAMRSVEGGVWIEPADAAELISGFKLGDLVTPAEASASLGRSAEPAMRTALELYRLYEDMLEAKGRLDFDDLIEDALRILRTDAEARAYWQDQYDCVLIDEYQDIEPAQELIVQILAAPQDNLFCVGDEDQCLYAWRRASVRRIIDLDQTYPGLERHALDTNYRCAAKIVRLSRNLIEHNENRFPKIIEPVVGAPNGEVVLGLATDLDAQAAHAARLADGKDRGEIAILARSTQVLRYAAIACARRGIKIDAPHRVLARNGVNATLLAYLRLFSDRTQARADDVTALFRVPNRYLPDVAAETVATRLRAGRSFSDALSGIGAAESWRRESLDKAGALFDTFATYEDARTFIHAIRTDGGLDTYYGSQQKLSVTDQSAIDTLEATEERAAGMTVAELADAFDYETRLIESNLDPSDGIELRTIHGAKGLEWPHVVVIGVDENEMPHQAALRDLSPAELLDAREDERRLAYVAFTRAKTRLTVLADRESPSPFIVEAMLNEVARQVELTDEASIQRADRIDSKQPTWTKLALPNGDVSESEAQAIIAELFANITPGSETVERHRQRCPRAYERWSADEDRVLAYLHESGLSVSAIAERLGRQHGAIRARLEKLELTPT